MDPSTNHRGWADRSGEFSPAYYAALGANEASKSLVTLFDHYSSRGASILALGCSSVRHLAHLYENGFDNLTGIDINDDSFTVMADAFPTVAEEGTFYTGAIEELVPEMADAAFDVVYSVETLQHIHPDDDRVFDELVRVTDGLLVTIENEGPDPDAESTGEPVELVNGEFLLYRRNWNRVFTNRGLTEQFCHPSKPDTIRAFGPADSD
jgi:SAM-dependent methyltransferase